MNILDNKQNKNIINYINEEFLGDISLLQSHLSSFIKPNKKEIKVISFLLKEQISNMFYEKNKCDIKSYFQKNVEYDGLKIIEHLNVIHPSHYGILCETIMGLYFNNLSINKNNILSELNGSAFYTSINKKTLLDNFNKSIDIFLKSKKRIELIIQRAKFIHRKMNYKCWNKLSNTNSQIEFFTAYYVLKTLSKKTNSEEIEILFDELIENKIVTKKISNFIKLIVPNFSNLKEQFNTKYFCHNYYQSLISHFEIDFFNENTILEIKASNKTFDENWFYQVILYHFCFKKNGLNNKYISIYNINNGNYWKIKVEDIIDERKLYAYLNLNKVI